MSIANILIVIITFSVCTWPMEETEIPSAQEFTSRSKEQQNTLDRLLTEALRALYEQLSPASRVPAAAINIKGNLDVITELIQQGANVMRPLIVHEAIEEIRQPSSILPLVILLSEGLDINFRNTTRKKQTAFFFMIQDPPLKIAQGRSIMTSGHDYLLIDSLRTRCPELEEITQWPQGPFSDSNAPSFKQGASDVKLDIRLRELLYWFIEQGADFDITDEEGNTPLTWAMGAQPTPKLIKIMSLLIDHGAAIPLSKDKIQNTISMIYPTTVATMANVVTRLLLERKEEEAQKYEKNVLDEQQSNLTHSIMQPFLLEGNAQELLKTVLDNQQLSPQQLHRLLKFTIARGYTDAASTIIEHPRTCLTLPCVHENLLTAAQTNRCAIIKLLIFLLDANDPHDKLVLNRALLAGAAKGYLDVVIFLLYTETKEEGAEPLLKKHKSEQEDRKEEENIYNAAEIFYRKTLFYAITRSARQGHDGVLEVLLRFIGSIIQPITTEQHQSNSPVKDKEPLDKPLSNTDTQWLSDTLTAALKCAIIQRHLKVVKHLLEHNQILGKPIPMDPIARMLNTVLANPFLSDQERQEYKNIFDIMQ